jgi:hypothetical protein
MKIIFLLASSFLLLLSAEARIVTLTVNGNPGNASRTNQMTIAASESVEWIARYGADITAIVVKDGISFTWQPSDSYSQQFPQRQIVSGPATVRVISTSSAFMEGYVTFNITPEAFPPDKTIVIPQGQGANIALECSTNLIDWTSASPGLYTNVAAAKFFRIRAERAP